MTDAYFYQDPYVKTLTANLMSWSENELVFNRSIFYPLGGGQPGDTGRLSWDNREVTVVDTRKDSESGEIRHLIEAPSFEDRPEVGTPMTLTLDWDRRYRHMQMHTAMHLLGALIPAPVTGGQVGADKSRLDFDIAGLSLDKDALTEQLNALINTGAALSFESISEAQLASEPELVRTMSVAPPQGAGDIRMIRIPNIDYQPCGGTHVRSLTEIHPLRVSKIENKGKQNRRVHIVFQQ